MSTYLAGLALGLSLIIAIGAQNAFVLKQGIQRQHVFLVCLLCAASDAILIAAGVAGFGVLIKQFPNLELFARYGGALFLFWYGLRSLYSAWNTNHALTPHGDSQANAKRTAILCLAFTWLNPHVYLDTVVLLGSISTQYEPNKLHFALGAISGSFLFFFTLGYGARLLAPIFRHPRSWKVLEAIIGIVMLLLAAKLLV
ncbi:LysE/ArgO family amino acid transporter [Vibrio scophthalmi]|uniref:Lysine exporter protein n=1 Tax=Vibrio scophthalmi TaxID=45658 RepID=A0A1E3WEM4_9VIBR|nr:MULTISPECIES: LysE/ArgO family amino acid transporter [Vibrio]EGU36096.1 putative lysine exporter protein [Vibrio sp. N418]MCY9802767.1 LysE/ArgO family amino acid transporter [Vibrio scophthalmi]ODS04236.1 Lysine exporter protein [Vibrio scophthalmi]